MSATLQTVIAALLVLAAVAYVGRRFWRSLRASQPHDDGCGSGCGCEGTTAPHER
jgi:hypothetical protein